MIDEKTGEHFNGDMKYVQPYVSGGAFARF